jgi:phosphonate transport system ATP-binding protein
MSAIEVRAVSKSFRRDRKALDGIGLSVRQGEMIALIGASGSGKSTLLRTICGLCRADADVGEALVSVGGQAVQSGGRLDGKVRTVRRDLGVIFQQFNLVSRLSLLTNVLLGLLGQISPWRGTLGLFTKAEKIRAMDALNRVGMAAYAGQRASTLSGGQQQRAAIARALIQGARTLLADEPIASLDPASATRVMETLAAINREDGITILVSLHQVDYAIKYCPRTIAMRDGKVVFDGASSLLTPDFLRELYGAESEDLLLATPPRETRPDSAPRGAVALATA